MFCSLRAECVEFLSQMRSGAVLMESRHGEGQTDKQELYQRKRIISMATALEQNSLFCFLNCRYHREDVAVRLTNLLQLDADRK